MQAFQNHVLLSRLQFALTLICHIPWPVLTIGMALFLVLVEGLWIRTNNPDYYRHARFWSRLFILNFGVGVATGLPLEFEFGTNWAPFAAGAGSFFGNMMGFESAMAFMLEAGFLGIMVFGWQRVPRPMHLFATLMVATGATMSAFWIMDANSWMQTPAGGHMVNGRFVVDSYVQAILNPDFPFAFGHMWVACLETSLFVIGGISAWFILKRRNTEFFLKSFRWALILAILVTPLQIYLGDGNGRTVFAYQPAKGAAFEGHWTTNAPGTGADWAILAWPDKAAQRNDWAITIPDALSWLATHTATGKVIGLKDFAPADQPPLLPLLFYGFRVMAGIGFALFFLMLWSVVVWVRGGLAPERAPRQRWLWYGWMAAIPLSYLAVEAGWVIREVGRQPWVIYGIMRTAAGASRLPAAPVGYSLVSFFVVYVVLLTSVLWFAARIVRQGPDLEVPLPEAAPHYQPQQGHRTGTAEEGP
ncbi:MAG: cytochrome ubiquinol oxidase subunit I [Stellaceae bacterium]